MRPHHELQKVRQAWPKAASAPREGVKLVAISDRRRLQVLARDQTTADEVAANSDAIANEVNHITRAPGLIVGVQATIADAADALLSELLVTALDRIQQLDDEVGGGSRS
jgi:hypothetical protein